MSKAKDLTNMRFGKLIVLRRVDNTKSGKAQWLCRCDCTIDRIDVNGNYCPENCRWVNSKCQCNNRRSNVHITYNGETHNITEWAKITGINRATISQRYKNGYTNKNLFSKERLNPWNRSSYGRYNTGVM